MIIRAKLPLTISPCLRANPPPMASLYPRVRRHLLLSSFTLRVFLTDTRVLLRSCPSRLSSNAWLPTTSRHVWYSIWVCCRASPNFRPPEVVWSQHQEFNGLIFSLSDDRVIKIPIDEAGRQAIEAEKEMYANTPVCYYIVRRLRLARSRWHRGPRSQQNADVLTWDSKAPLGWLGFRRN